MRRSTPVKRKSRTRNKRAPRSGTTAAGPARGRFFSADRTRPQPGRTADWVLALLLAWLATAVILLSSTYLFRWLGESVLTALERVMGMLLIALSVQMFMSGVASFLHSVP